jgi:hypothetical protein
MAKYCIGKTESGADSRSHNVTEREEMLNDLRKEFEAELQLEADLRGSEVALSKHEDGTYRVAAIQSAWWGFHAGRRTTPDRDSIIEECAKVMDDRATEIEANGNLTSMTMGRIYRAEAEHIRALKTAPNGEKK